MKKTKTCPACLSDIPEVATKCRFCATTQIEAVVASAKPSAEFIDSGLSKTCKDCCRQVDKNARRCPYCRTLLKTHPFTMCCAWFFGVSFAFMFFGAFVSGCESGDRAARTKPAVSESGVELIEEAFTGKDYSALVAVRTAIRSQYGNDVVFQDVIKSDNAISHIDNIYTVKMWAELTKGGKKTVTASVQYNGGNVYAPDSWEVLDVKIN